MTTLKQQNFPESQHYSVQINKLLPKQQKIFLNMNISEF